MNNLNNPDGGADGSKWNYALLVHALPMLGLAAFTYNRTKESQKEIEEIKIKYDKIIKTSQTRLEQTLSEKTRLQEENEKALKIKDQAQLALVALKEVECRLVERQWAFCSYVVSHNRRREIENDLYQLARKSVFANLNMENGLREIFKNDRSCSDLSNRNDRNNGGIMWKYLRQWEMQLTPKTKAMPEILNELKTFFKSIS